MTAATHLIKPTALPSNVRPLDMRRDLLPVADLVELCFADTLDTDGRRYIQHIRSTAGGGRSTLNPPSQLSRILRGFVWEEDGRVVGNLNMISVTALHKRAYLFANVAVHPDYRQRGIAHALTQAGMDHVRARRVKHVWLQVNAQNPAAIHLYKTSGFTTRATRTTWHNTPRQLPTSDLPANVAITATKRSDWQQQYTWLRRDYPGAVRWYLPINFNLLRPGLAGTVRRMVNEGYLHQWAARCNDQLIGTLAWQSSNRQADILWLAAARGQEEAAIVSLLTHVQKESTAPGRTKDRILAVNYPAGQANAAFEQAGFHIHNTLIWMHTELE